MKRSIGLLLVAFLLAWGITVPGTSASAAAMTGWKHVNGHWYYYTAKGKATGWVKVSNKWYYLDSTGAMKTGWVKVSNKWYYLNASGVMLTGWVKLSNKWYFLNASGVMPTGWLKQGTKTYYLLSSGAMATGWQTIAGKQYYFYPSGIMAVNTTINGKVIGSDGAVKPAPLTPTNKAINDAKAAGVTVTANSDGSYYLSKNGKNIGDFNHQLGYVDGDNSYTALLETIAVDLGFNANLQELNSLVAQVQSGKLNSYSVSDDGSTLSIQWDQKVPTASSQSLQAIKDIQAAGAVAKPGALGTYNIFKGNVYIAYFDPDADYPSVEGVNTYTTLLEKLALDIGYNANAQELQSLVDQTQNGTTTNYSVTDDGTTLSIYWDGKATAPTAAATKAFNDLQAVGAVAKLAIDGSYNIYKDNTYIGYFDPNQKYPNVDGDSSYAGLFVTLAIDLGYPSTAADLTNQVQSVMAGTTPNNNNIVYIGHELGIYWVVN